MTNGSIRKNNKDIDMINGNMSKNMIKFAIPILLTGALQMFYSAADLIVCNLFGSSINSTAAISATLSIISLLINFFSALAIGGSILMSRAYGNKDQEKGKKVVNTSILSSIIFGIVIGTMGYLLTYPMLRLTNTPKEIIDSSASYMKITFIGAPLSIFYNFASVLVIATGDTKSPFWALTLSGMVNVILNCVFVIFIKLDVAGTAIATVISTFVCDVILIIFMIKNKGFLVFELKKMKIYKEEFFEMLKIGIPSGLQTLALQLTNILVYSTINKLGPDAVDGCGAANSIETLVYWFSTSITQGVLAFASANYAINNVYNIKKVIKNGLVLSILVVCINCILIFPLMNVLFKLFVTSEAGITAAKQKYFICSLSYIIYGPITIFANGMRSINKPIIPSISTIVPICICRIIWVIIVSNVPSLNNLIGICIIFPISFAITLAINCFLFLYFFNKYILKIKSEENNTINLNTP